MIDGLDGWAEADTAAGAAVLGLGGCLDYEISWDASVLEECAREHHITADDVTHGTVIGSERELVASVLAFFRDGAGGERPVASGAIIETFSARFPRRITLGGTSVRAAIAMSRIGVASSLHLVSIDEHVRRLLPPDVPWICSGAEDSLNPHLIVQFPRGATVNVAGTVIESRHANRLIYVCDPPNREMHIAPELGPMLANAKVFLISGFNAMTDRDALENRLNSLRDAMSSLPKGALVVFEDGGYHVPELSDVVVNRLVDRLDIYGMNEDELQSLIGRTVDLLDPADVAAAVSDASRRIPVPTLIIHTSQWAAAYGTHARRWADALDGGIALAGARYLTGDALDATAFERAKRLPRQRAGERFAATLEGLLGADVCARAAYALATETPTTVGLGDTFVGGVIAVLARRSSGGRDLA